MTKANGAMSNRVALCACFLKGAIVGISTEREHRSDKNERITAAIMACVEEHPYCDSAYVAYILKISKWTIWRRLTVLVEEKRIIELFDDNSHGKPKTKRYLIVKAK